MVARIHRIQKFCGEKKEYNKDLHNPYNHDGIITHLDPDILECKVKQALGSITMNKASEGDGTLAELFQILKDDTLSVALNTQQVWNPKQ